MKYNGFDIPDEIIDNYVNKLGCSISEACDAWLCDNGKADSEEADAMTKKAAAAGIGKIVDADYKKTERKSRERKINEDKRTIIDILESAINDAAMDFDFSEAIVRNPEKYIDFEYNGKSYTINLVEHRKKGE